MLHTSTLSTFLVEPVAKVLPQAQVYLGIGVIFWGEILSFIALNSVNAGLSPVLAGRFVFYQAINQGKESIVLPDTDVTSRVNPGAPLAH